MSSACLVPVSMNFQFDVIYDSFLAHIMGTTGSLAQPESDRDRQRRTGMRDMEGGNGSGPAGVVGRAGRVRTGMDWDGRRGEDGATGTKKYPQTSTLVGYLLEYRSFYGGKLG